MNSEAIEMAVRLACERAYRQLKAEQMTSIRIDDIGSASKRWEYHAPKTWQNVWPLHSRRVFGCMAPYRELSAEELETIFSVVQKAGRVVTIALTAYWVSWRGSLKSFNRKYPAQAAVIALYARRGVVEVAAHGCTHMQVGFHRPKLIGSNRYFHRERGPWRDEAKRSIESWLELPVTRFVEPGQIGCIHSAPGCKCEVVFHDRDFVLNWPNAMKRLLCALR